MLISTIIISAISTIGIAYLLKNLIEYMQMYLAIHKLPGPPGSSFLFGNIKPLFSSRQNFFNHVTVWSLEYYPIYKIFAGHMNIAVISSPEDMELILTSMVHIKKSRIYDFLFGWLGTGLLTSSGQKWHTRRKILTPAFHFNILQQFIEIFNDETNILVEELKEECNKSHINVTKHITQFALKSISETAMGTKIANSDREIKYKNAIYDVGKIYLHRILRPWMQVPWLYIFSPLYYKEKQLINILHNFTNSVISERKTTFNLDSITKRKKLAMLDLLLAQKSKDNNIDDEGIREEVDTFMFEGHDTTTLAITYAIMLIANHPEVQTNLIKEMQQVLGNIKKRPTYNDLQELKYMERTIKETLRLYPSVHFISRVLGEDLKTHSGYHLRKKSIMILHIYSMHHNPKIYPDPEKFDPDRFLPENCQKRHPFAYIPFSAGPRNCIGQKFALLELKAVLCGILANFILEPVDTPSSITLVADIVLRTEDGVKAKIRPRPDDIAI